jgi:hypothetical protein
MNVLVLLHGGQRERFGGISNVVLWEPGQPMPPSRAGLLVLLAPAVVGWQIEAADEAEQ